MRFKLDWSEWGTGKKIAVVLVVCCIGCIIIGMIAGVGTPDQNTNKATGTQVKIIYDGSWSGSILNGSSSSSYSGDGNETINITNSSDYSTVSATIQKQGGNSRDLKVQIIRDGEVKKEENTTAEYGVVSIAD
ncbi:hypothetical protein OTK55_05180 [Methanosphaera sp. Vir-13MRS]|uniref:hypothetical protein n=1 Tax=Candidatus Methanosphaera massiliense TaxID=3017187 RepID=UPI00237FD819|nr:hypothetical protein [Candidatus Methanosphaera massiliense]MDE4078403.1 hypothetical protein [Candidatus Methanosphaera massiliense]